MARAYSGSGAQGLDKISEVALLFNTLLKIPTGSNTINDFCQKKRKHNL